ncbi:MAG: ImmA/IrrE family metallo-endopeptidase [Deltaproteobacteria bacterium]|nr:ImmA/IrrE family metallo-endopeptidase [Deltaproteobacteria bacterium]
MTTAIPNFHEVRTDAGLTVAALASITGLEPARLRDLEGGAIARPDELDAWARGFGVRIQDLVGANPQSWPLARLAFRASSDGVKGLEALVEDGSYRVIGDFLRCVAEVKDLEDPSARASLPALTIPAGWEDAAPWGAARLASQLRAELGLSPTEPVSSMVRLLRDELSVVVFFVSPEQLAPTIDAASTNSPRPAVLVNLIEGQHAWWRTRMSLAHELCHLLLDQDEEAPPSVSPDSRFRSRYQCSRDFALVEKRANAFAAHLLAPDAGVRDAVGRLLPSSEDAIVAVSRTFGLGRTSSINRLQHVFGLSNSTRERMLDRPNRSWNLETVFDETARVGLRDGELLDLAMRAYVEGRVDAVEVRRCLEIAPTEELPAWDSLPEERRAPVRAVETQVLSVAGRFLMEHAEPGLVAVRPTRTDHGWQVQVEGGSSDRSISVSFDYEVEPPHWLTVA